MQKIILILMLTIFATATSNAQAKAVNTGPPEVLIAMSVDLTEGKLCGNVEDRKSETISGTVVRRDFGEDKMTLEGIVLKSGKDLRTFVNIDYEFLQGETANLSSQLSELLIEGKKVSIETQRCGRVIVAKRLLSSKDK